MKRITRGGVVGAAVTAILIVALMSGTAFADGGRTLTFDSPEGQPQSGMPTTLVVRLVEGEHLVAGAQVFVAVTPTGVDAPPNGGAGAVPGDTPGEYVASVVFPSEGTWRVWLMAEEGGDHTMSAYEVDVAPVAGASASGTADMEGMQGMDHGAEATVVEPMEGMEGMSHSDGSAAVSAAEGDGHSESESAAAGHGGGGGVNWWVISAFLAVIAVGVIGAVGLKARLRRQMALGALAPEGASDV
ncbi:MAG: FixH family protein [Thermoleophilia bacterium]